MAYSRWIQLAIGSLAGSVLVAGSACGDDGGGGGTGDASTTGTSAGPTTAADSSSSGNGPGSSESSDGSDSSDGSGSSSSSSSGSSSSSSTGAMLACGAMEIVDLDTALSILWADVPPIGGTTDSGGGSGGGPDPDALLVRLTNTTLVCADPFNLPPCNGQTLWTLSFTLPTGSQVPGVYDLDALGATYGESFGGAGGPDCQGGGGGSVSGTLTITEVTAAGVVGCLDNVDTIIGPDDLNGAFSTTACN